MVKREEGVSKPNDTEPVSDMLGLRVLKAKVDQTRTTRQQAHWTSAHRKRIPCLVASLSSDPKIS